MQNNKDNRITRAHRFACVAHRNQKYGDAPYITHLHEVAQVVYEFRDLFDPHELEMLLCAAWLHDVLEDTETLPSALDKTFGYDITNLVLGVTNPVGHATVLGKYTQLGIMLERNPLVEPLKLADRIANCRNGKLNRKYQKEQPLLEQALRRADSKYPQMWQALDTALQKEYAQ